jgi:hypothetical protein
MTDGISVEEKKIVEEAMKRIRANDRHLLPPHKVKQFLQTIGEELKRTGALKQEFVDRLVQQIRTGATDVPGGVGSRRAGRSGLSMPATSEPLG